MPDFIKSKYYFQFLIKKLRGTSFFNACKKAASHLRRVFLIGRIIRYVGIAITVIQTSAALIAAAAFLLILIPLLLLIAISAFVTDMIQGTRIIKDPMLIEYLKRERITVFAEAGTFGRGFAEELASEGAAVFVVCSDPTKLFISAKLKNGVYYLSPPFYFRLKRKHFKNLEDRITYLL